MQFFDNQLSLGLRKEHRLIRYALLQMDSNGAFGDALV